VTASPTSISAVFRKILAKNCPKASTSI
jgi:hypothetical protein